MAEYISAPIPVDPDELKAEAFDYLRDKFPGWEPADGNLDAWIIEAYAELVAQVGETASDVTTAIFRYYGSKVASIPPQEAVQSTGLVTVTAIDSTGHTIPAGTTVAFGADFVPFQTIDDAVIPASSTSVSSVPVIAVDAGASGAGITGTGTLIDPFDFILSVELEAATTGGADAESDEAYLNRLADELSILAPRPILAADFATLARRVAGVDRALAIDNYIPGANEKQTVTQSGATAGNLTLTFEGQTTANVAYNAPASTVQTRLEGLSNVAPGDVVCTGGPLGTAAVTVEFTGALEKSNRTQMTANTTGLTGGSVTIDTTQEGAADQTDAERAVTVVCVDEAGNAVGTTTKQAVDDLLQGEREVNFIVSVADPEYTTIDVNFTATAWDGFVAADVEAAAISALTTFLSPADWGQPTFGETRAWVNEPKVRYLEVAQVLNSVEGLRYVDTLTIEGGSTDVTMTGVAPMPQPGTITGTVS